MMRLLYPALPLLFVFATAAVELEASCPCMIQTGDSAYRSADIAFVGVPFYANIEDGFSRQSAPVRLKRVRFRVEKAYKGLEGVSEVVISKGAHRGACGYEFKIGQRYLVFAFGGEESGYTADRCNGSVPLDIRSDLFRFLERLDSGDHRSWIVGRIAKEAVGANPFRYFDLNGRGALELLDPRVRDERDSAQVILSRDGVDERVVGVDGSGIFRIEDLSPGEYQVKVVLSPEWDPHPLQRKVVLEEPMAFKQLFFTMPGPSGALLVSLPNGQDLPCPLRVQMLRDEVPTQGFEIKQEPRIELRHRAAGTYRFRIPMVPRDAVYPPLNRSGVDLPAGEIVRVRWELPQLTQQVVEGTILLPDGSPAPNASIVAWGAASKALTQSDAEGRFRLPLCAPLLYERLGATASIKAEAGTKYYRYLESFPWSINALPNDVVIRLKKPDY